jgi:phosphoserine phosphatase
MLVAFDFDGTLSPTEMMVSLGQQYGVAAEIESITRRAMNDELSYAQSLRTRAELLAGLAEPAVVTAFERVALEPGAAALVGRLRAADHHVVVLTGGFERGVAAALEAEGVTVDAVVANRLVIADGALTGVVEGPLIEGTKDDQLSAVAAEKGIPMGETVAIGDGANDIPMLERAAVAIGYAPKRAVRDHCDHVVDTMEELERRLQALAVL